MLGEDEQENKEEQEEGRAWRKQVVMLVDLAVAKVGGREEDMEVCGKAKWV